MHDNPNYWKFKGTVKKLKEKDNKCFVCGSDENIVPHSINDKLYGVKNVRNQDVNKILEIKDYKEDYCHQNYKKDHLLYILIVKRI